VCHCRKRYIIADAENVDCALVRGATNELRYWIEREIDNVGSVSASTELLDLLACLCVVDSYHLALKSKSISYCSKQTWIEEVARSVPS
jgi:hypothetical protein